MANDKFTKIMKTGYRNQLEPPQNVKIKRMFLKNDGWNGALLFEWNSPREHDAKTMYQIEYAEQDKENWKRLSDLRGSAKETRQLFVSMNETKFSTDKLYKFRVKSKNVWLEPVYYCVVGDPSNIALPLKPSCPKNVYIALLNKTSQTVTYAIKWQRPDDTGSSDIIQYIIKYKNVMQWEIAETVKSDQLKAVVTINVNEDGDNQSFMVLAVNVAGMSDNCQPVDMVKPSCPKNANITNINGTTREVQISWQQPDDKGSSEITQYIIKYKNRTNNEEWDIAVATSSKRGEKIVIDAKKDITNLLFMVLAVNRAGISDDCPYDYIDRPDIPKNVTVEVKKKLESIKFKVLPPKYCGNRDCNGYILNVWPHDYVEELRKEQKFDGIPTELVHYCEKTEDKIQKKSGHDHFTVKASDLVFNLTKIKVKYEKLKIDLKSGLKYGLSIASQNHAFAGLPVTFFIENY